MNNPLKVLTKAVIITSLGLFLSINPVISHAKDTLSTASIQKEVSQEKVVNLNKSTFAELVTLKGIGHTKAKAIIAYRQQVGQFKSIKELSKVSGIGDKIVSKNKARLSI